jgi:iron complex transport system ATP-binding protein
MNTSISLSHVSVSIKDHTLVTDISFELERGQVMSIIGPNGAGKSTLLSAITGDLEYDGDISISGLSEKTVERARQISVLPQLSLLNFPFRVHEVVGLSRIPHCTGKQNDAVIVNKALELMDISFLADRLYTELSGGEKQRVQLARVFAQIWQQSDAAQGSRILLLDEPTAALDLGHQQLLMRTIRKQAASGVTIIMVLHDLNLVARYSDRILALQCSEQAAFGSPQDVITADNVNRLFDVNTIIVPHPDDGIPIVTGI